MTHSLVTPIKALFLQLEDMLDSLTDEEYSRKIGVLSDASIGQHTRHIIEFFVELFIGYDKGLVNYDRRKRDKRIESSRGYARQVLEDIAAFLDHEDKPLTVAVDFSAGTEAPYVVATNFHRE